MKRHEVIIVLVLLAISVGTSLAWLNLSRVSGTLPHCTPTIDGKRSGGCSGDWQSVYDERGSLVDRVKPGDLLYPPAADE